MEKLNVGGALNLKSGIFSAPRTGTYFFSFSAISGGGNLYIGLYVNDNRIGTGHSTSGSETLSIHSTLYLNVRDNVSMRIWHGSYLHDNINHYTHFIGWLVEEDLSL